MTAFTCAQMYGAHVFDPRLAPQLLSQSDRNGKLLRRHAIPIIGAARELVTLDQLHAAVRSSTKRPLIIHIFAPLSQPCQDLLPKLEAAVRATHGSVDLVSLNVNNKGALSQGRAIPCRSLPERVWGEASCVQTES